MNNYGGQLTLARGNNGSLYKVEMNYGNYGRINTSNTTFTDPQTNNSQTQYNNYIYPSVSIPSNSFAPTSATTNNGTIDFEFGINGSMRKRTNNSTQKTEYYLFNAFNQMKAYSNNGETYGYYGYDDAGQRTYKMILNTVSSNTSTYPNTKILDVEKVQLYPNGFININQNGEYTKHYYAGSARIASKIGSGFGDNITCTTDNLKVNYLLKVMKTELGKLTNETVDDIENNFAQITHLIGEDPKSYEDGLYFYHGNHLSSTQLITDMYGAVNQAVLYAPFGQIISEYRSDWMLDTIPRYLFTGMERDAESGLDYMNARYYNSGKGTFESRDRLFEKYFWMSPYAYCANNPMNYIDPDGRYKISTNEPTKKYSTILTNITNNMSSYVTGNTNIMNALALYGKFSKEDIDNILGPNGPTIAVADTKISEYDPSNNTITIRKDLLDFYKNAKGEDKEAAMLLIVATILHETVERGKCLQFSREGYPSTRTDSDNSLFVGNDAKIITTRDEYGNRVQMPTGILKSSFGCRGIVFESDIYFDGFDDKYNRTFWKTENLLESINVAKEVIKTSNNLPQLKE